MEHKFTMSLSLNVLNHLGINLYSNVPAVLSEIVANSWDADAENVTIAISSDEIIIEDNGCGMTVSDINSHFLKVGYVKQGERSKLSKIYLIVFCGCWILTPLNSAHSSISSKSPYHTVFRPFLSIISFIVSAI